MKPPTSVSMYRTSVSRLSITAWSLIVSGSISIGMAVPAFMALAAWSMSPAK